MDAIPLSRAFARFKCVIVGHGTIRVIAQESREDDFVDDRLSNRFVYRHMHYSDRCTALLLFDVYARQMEESKRAAHEAGTVVRQLVQNDARARK